MSAMLKTFIRLSMILLSLFSIGAQADILDDILKRGTVRVGVALFTPWTMKRENGQLYGYEIDVAEKIAQDMGVKPEFKVYNWEDIIAGLEEGEIDVIAGGMAITPARALKVNFSLPYLQSGVTLATNTELTKNINKLEQLNRPEIVIATVAETLAADVAQRLFDKADIKIFPTSEAAEKEILEGNVHVYLASMPEVKFLALQYPDKVDLPLSEPLLASKAGLAVKKGEQEWLNFLNAWVTAREADRWLITAQKYWFDSLQWSEETKQ